MIEFFVSGQSLKFFTPVVAADSLNYLTAKVNFNEEWYGYSKWLHFRQGEDLSATVYDISLDENDEVTADDALNLGIGEWEIYVTGTKDSSRLTTETVILTVKESGLIDAPLHGLPMSAAEQIDFKANQALFVAMSVKEDAENGKFDGKSFAVKGFYASLDDLLSSATPEIGDAYGVGTDEPYDIYMWDSINSAWVNIGPIQGVKGDDGAQGVTFTPVVDSNGNISWTNDGGLENPVVRNIRGPKGEAGAQGADGKSPYQIASENGYTGTETTFNNSLIAFPYHNARHLPDGADPITVKTGNIEDNAVTAAKLKDGAVSRAKLAQDALYSPITKPTTTTYNVVASDLGKTIVDAYSTRNNNLTWNLSKSLLDSFPIGAEVAFARTYTTQSITLNITGARIINADSGQVGGASQTVSFSLPERGSMCAFKKLENDSTYGSFWILTGNVEVV